MDGDDDGDQRSFGILRVIRNVAAILHEWPLASCASGCRVDAGPVRGASQRVAGVASFVFACLLPGGAGRVARSRSSVNIGKTQPPRPGNKAKTDNLGNCRPNQPPAQLKRSSNRLLTGNR